MAQRRSFWSVLGSWWSAFKDFLVDKTPDETRLRDDAQEMLNELNLRADAASYAMALSDEEYKKLSDELANYENLKIEAKRYLTQGLSYDEAKARRCTALMLQSQSTIERLKQGYQARQQDAETRVRDFKAKQQEVNARVAELPRLEDDLRQVQTLEKIEKMEAKFNLESAARSFDEKAREIEMRKRQIANKALITADPNSWVDAEIRRDQEQTAIETAMQELRKEADAEGHIIEGEFTVKDPVREARKMLEAPRFAELLPPLPDSERKCEPVAVRRLPAAQ